MINIAVALPAVEVLQPRIGGAWVKTMEERNFVMYIELVNSDLQEDKVHVYLHQFMFHSVASRCSY